MSRRLTLFLISTSFLLIFYNCEKQITPDKTEVEPKTQNPEFIISASDINKIDYVEYALSDQSERVTSNWQKFRELETQIEILKTGDFSFFTEDKAIIQGFLTDLSNEIPEALDEPSIQVRLTALSTAIYKLEGGFKFDRKNKTGLLNNIEDLLKAYTNLVFQINKKLEKEAQNIAKPRVN